LRLSRQYDAYAEISGRLRQDARIVHENKNPAEAGLVCGMEARDPPRRPM
jgi:hypothetical protein